MKKSFVDTNIFIHVLFDFDPRKHARAKKLFEKAAAGKVDLWTTEWVMVELVWFLKRRKLTTMDIKEKLDTILSSVGLEVRNRLWISYVFETWRDPMNILDAVHVVEAKKENVEQVYSYDKDFDHVVGIKRREP